jgi:hypothetical protein
MVRLVGWFVAPFAGLLLLNAWGELPTKFAVTVTAPVIVTVQVPVPEQPPPLQPAKVEPAAGDAVRVTIALLLYVSEQSEPQLMPAGLLVTVPLPLPVLLRVKVNA